MLSKILVKQLGHPSGVIGRYVLPRLWNARNAALNNVTFEQLALTSSERVLEVGFGGGSLLKRMATILLPGHLAGVDWSAAVVASARKRYAGLIRQGRLDLQCAAAEALPYPDQAFTKVCSVNSLFYWRHAPSAITECWRVLEAGGAIVLCVTCPHALPQNIVAQPGVTRYSRQDIHMLLKHANFGEIRAIQETDRYRDFVCVIGRK